MNSGWVFLVISALICIGVFERCAFCANDQQSICRTQDRVVSIEGFDLPVFKIRMIGRLQMIAAPIFLLIFAALSFGLLGPVDGIQTIKL